MNNTTQTAAENTSEPSANRAAVRSELVDAGICADSLARLDRAAKACDEAERAWFDAREGDRLARRWFSTQRVLGQAYHAFNMIAWDEQRAAHQRAA